MARESRKKVRLVGVTAQFEFVVDDGDHLTPLLLDDGQGGRSKPAVSIPAADWPTYATSTFLEAVAALEADVNGEAKPESGKS